MKVFLRNVHLYLALGAGLIIMLSCITGAIMVFEDELDQWGNHQRYFVERKGERLPMQQLIGTALQRSPKAKLAAVKVFSDPSRSVEVALIVPEKKGGKDDRREGESGKRNEAKGRHTREDGKKGNGKHAGKGKDANEKNAKKGPKGGAKPGIFVYVNPYNGQVTGVYNKKESFFFTVESLHRWLLGGQNSVGKTIIGLSTLSFLIITLTGIVLWWPKNKKILMQRLKFKTNGSFKRLNHDLHIVTGFYTSLFLVVIIVTGLVMAFGWVSKGIYTMTGTSPESPEPPLSVYLPEKQPVSYDAVLNNSELKILNVEFYTIRAPKDSTGIYSVNVLTEGATENKSDTYYIDQYTGAVIGQLKFTGKNLGQRIRSYAKTVHTGAIFGIPSKTLAFILCLLTFSFPITGVIMWLNRIKKSKNKKVLR